MVLALAACGDGSGGSGGSSSTGEGGATATGVGGSTASAGEGGSTASGDGGGVAAPTRRGDLYVNRIAWDHDDADSWDEGVVLGWFEAEPAPASPGCPTTTVGSCTVVECVRDGVPGGSGEEPEYVSAGAISLEGTVSPVTSTFDADLSYQTPIPGDLARADHPFAAGAPLRLSATGADVPAFEVTVEAPARVAVTSPVLEDGLVVPRDEDFTVTWEPGPGRGDLHVTFSSRDPLDQPDGRHVQVFCWVDVAAGTLTVPGDALARLPAQPEEGGSLFVLSRTAEETVAGDWRVTASVSDATYLLGTVALP